MKVVTLMTFGLIISIFSMSFVFADLQAYYPFNEGNGQTTNDAENNHDGILGNSLAVDISDPSWTTGPLGNALDFGGNDKVKIDPVGLDMDSWSALTVSAWVRNDIGVGAGTDDIVGWWNFPGSKSWILTHHNNNKYFFEISGKGLVTGGTVSKKWTHVAGVYNGSSMKLYVNGVLVDSIVGLSGTLPFSTADLIIGSQEDGSNYFDGIIDDVRIYNMELTQSQISDLYFKPVNVCSGADIIIPINLNVVGNGCHANPSIDTEIVSMSLSGSYSVFLEVHRSGPGSSQPKEEFTFDVNGNTSSNIFDFPDDIEIQEQFAGNFNFNAGDNNIEMESTAICPPDTTPNSVEIVNLCLIDLEPCTICQTRPKYDCNYLEALTDNALNNLGYDNVVRLPFNGNYLGGDGSRDIIFTSGGDNTINTGNMDDFICAGNGVDNINAGEGDDVIFGGIGNDIINAGSGHDYIDAGSGNDEVNGEIGNDCIRGGVGNDEIDGGSGEDKIEGNSGVDQIDGGIANDVITGGQKGDTINGGGGSDQIGGGFGDDFINGGSGSDSIDGGIGKDTLNGDGGNDIIQGAFGADTINGGSGNNDKSDNDPADLSVINVEDIGGAPIVSINLNLDNCFAPMTFCGDGIVQNPNDFNQNEECDDGANGNVADGCKDDCTLCDDQDDDGICDEDDFCPDSRPRRVDINGCDIFQFCEGLTCGLDCFEADFLYDEPNELYPKDCTVIIPLRNGIEQQPICVPTENTQQCSG